MSFRLVVANWIKILLLERYFNFDQISGGKTTQIIKLNESPLIIVFVSVSYLFDFVIHLIDILAMTPSFLVLALDWLV